MRPAMPMRTQAGFTLVELIVVVTLLGILGVGAYIGLKPLFQSYGGAAQRAELTAAAEAALQRVTRELRNALPNSVRVSGGTALEFINTVDGGRYRADFSSLGGGDPLDFASLSDGFDVLGGLAATTPAAVTTGAGSAQACDGARACIVIYNTGFPASAADALVAGSSNNAYLGPGTGNCVPGATWCGNVATLAGVSTTFASFDNAGLTGWHFPTASPRQRFFIAEGPVSYVCDTAARSLRRYAGYALAAVQVVPPVGATADNLLTNRVTACAFSYSAGTATREALVTISLTLTGDNGQSVTLHQQAHVSNEQ